jgi:uncharacterized protein YhfF
MIGRVESRVSLKITKEIQNYWNYFIEKNELPQLLEFKFEAWSFGNTKAMADELGLLVLEGKKTATCSLLRAYQGDEDEIPRVGVYSVLCDGNEKPICVTFLTDTWICKYNEVSKKHAYEEGEGDRTLEHWKKVHHEFFSESGDFKEDEELICERMKVVHK